jgi:DNA-binding MarR family transcriptional regulator
MDPPDVLDHGMLHDLLGHLLRHAFNRGQSVFSDVFEREHITPLQFMMVELIALNSGVTHSQICQSMAAAASVITTSLKPLIAAEHIVRAPSSTDKRMVCYRLTPKGARWFHSLRPKIDLCEERFANALTPAQRASLAGMLRTLSGLGQPDGA